MEIYFIVTVQLAYLPCQAIDWCWLRWCMAIHKLCQMYPCGAVCQHHLIYLPQYKSTLNLFDMCLHLLK